MSRVGRMELKGPIYPSLALRRAVPSRHAYTLGAVMQFMILIQSANISSPNRGISYVSKMVHKKHRLADTDESGGHGVGSSQHALHEAALQKRASCDHNMRLNHNLQAFFPRDIRIEGEYIPCQVVVGPVPSLIQLRRGCWMRRGRELSESHSPK